MAMLKLYESMYVAKSRFVGVDSRQFTQLVACSQQCRIDWLRALHCSEATPIVLTPNLTEGALLNRVDM